MRNHKYRAWIAEYGGYADGVCVFHDGSWDAEFVTEAGTISGASEKEGDVLELFTGLTDKNGVEIFEGDIVTGNKVVKWFDDLTWDSGGSNHPGFYFGGNGCEEDGELDYHTGFDDDTEVIGNIHQQPELIKEI